MAQLGQVFASNPPHMALDSLQVFTGGWTEISVATHKTVTCLLRMRGMRERLEDWKIRDGGREKERE